MTIPKHYVPRTLSRKDRNTQRKHIHNIRTLYKKGTYKDRPKLKSFRSKPSPHVTRAKKMYRVSKIVPSNTLARKTQCSLKGLRQIAKKGRGAYYSSGSRPNQTAQSWARARLASSLTGGNAALVDYHILSKECKSSSKALRLANKTRKRATKKRATKKGD